MRNGIEKAGHLLRPEFGSGRGIYQNCVGEDSSLLLPSDKSVEIGGTINAAVCSSDVITHLS